MIDAKAKPTVANQAKAPGAAQSILDSLITESPLLAMRGSIRNTNPYRTGGPCRDPAGRRRPPGSPAASPAAASSARRSVSSTESWPISSGLPALLGICGCAILTAATPPPGPTAPRLRWSGPAPTGASGATAAGTADASHPGHLRQLEPPWSIGEGVRVIPGILAPHRPMHPQPGRDPAPGGVARSPGARRSSLVRNGVGAWCGRSQAMPSPGRLRGTRRPEWRGRVGGSAGSPHDRLRPARWRTRSHTGLRFVSQGPDSPSLSRRIARPCGRGLRPSAQLAPAPIRRVAGGPADS